MNGAFIAVVGLLAFVAFALLQYAYAKHNKSVFWVLIVVVAALSLGQQVLPIELQKQYAHTWKFALLCCVAGSLMLRAIAKAPKKSLAG